VALVRQWRLPANAALLEIPAGGLDVHEDGSKEDPDLAAPRELEEETGLRARSWRKLGVFYSAPGFTDELMHLYLATDLEPAADGRLGPDEDERLILEWRPWRDAVAAAERGEIRDAKSIVGLFWLARLREGVAGVDGPHVAAAESAVPAEPVGDVARAAFRLSTSDMVHASVALMRRSLSTRLMGGAMITVAVVLLFLVQDLTSVAIFVLGLTFVTGWFAAPFAWYQARKRPDLVSAEVTVTADDRGIRFTSPLYDGFNDWDTYFRVHEAGGFLFLDTSTGINQLVPKRAFSPTDLATFYRLLERSGLLAGRGSPRS
jgi:8-oxo-dGTP pyrophosphatase MutT (NUDIX family)